MGLSWEAAVVVVVVANGEEQRWWSWLAALLRMSRVGGG